jgi:major vault protein
MDSMDRMQQKDLVLNVNEYAYVLDQTKGNVVCWVGPSKTSLSNSDQLVTFNEKTKRFVPCGFTDAVKLFTTAPKGWYVVLKNPAKDRERGLDKHPGTGTSNSIPEGMEVGKKINIEGPVSFALYPGQMAKVIEGHILRSNQYIMVRVYDADAAAKSTSTEKAEKTYTPGQMMVIKGTEVSFYIPPTGFEIVKNNGSFVQDAVTLEKLEYCILKNENGNKRYVQGPAVVFPEPTESFITNDDGSFKFRAIELSKISGIYIKVIEEYKENGKEYHIGDELFITGNDQMIYYPRPEHAIIQYGEKIVHHSIAIPKGEGRYLMNRLTGEIKTVIGSMMLLPDPRKEVIVKRKLSRNSVNCGIRATVRCWTTMASLMKK